MRRADFAELRRHFPVVREVGVDWLLLRVGTASDGAHRTAAARALQPLDPVPPATLAVSDDPAERVLRILVGRDDETPYDQPSDWAAFTFTGA